MTERDDHDLRDRFQELRREDLRHATPFTPLRATARATRPHRRFVIGLTAALVGGVVLVIRFTRPHRDAAPFDLATVRWQGPTDFLLQLPGEELLRTVPELGRGTFPGAAISVHDLDRRTP
jgi:hypothetical protein